MGVIGLSLGVCVCMCAFVCAGRGVESICVRPKGGGPSVAPVLVATSHLESPMGRGQECVQ